MRHLATFALDAALAVAFVLSFVAMILEPYRRLALLLARKA